MKGTYFPHIWEISCLSNELFFLYCFLLVFSQLFFFYYYFVPGKIHLLRSVFTKTFVFNCDKVWCGFSFSVDFSSLILFKLNHGGCFEATGGDCSEMVFFALLDSFSLVSYFFVFPLCNK